MCAGKICALYMGKIVGGMGVERFGKMRMRECRLGLQRRKKRKDEERGVRVCGSGQVKQRGFASSKVSLPS